MGQCLWQQRAAGPCCEKGWAAAPADRLSPSLIPQESDTWQLHQDEEDSIHLFKPNIASQAFPFPYLIYFIAFFFSPRFLHAAAYVSATLWHEQSHRLPVQQFQNDVIMSWETAQHWWVNLSGEEKGCPWRGWMMHPTKSKLRAEGCFPGWQHREQKHAQGTDLPTLALIWLAVI